MAEGQWKWDENLHLEFTSAFFTGVYGMWNIYIFAMIVLYAPSHKQWPSSNGSNSRVCSSLQDSANGKPIFARLKTKSIQKSIHILISLL